MIRKITALLLLFGVSSYLNSSFALDGPERQCYGISMVGYDSVINSRLGVPPETVLHLAKYKINDGNEHYAPYLLNVILDAYLWEQSPHDYAVKTMFQCAINTYRNNMEESLAKTNYDLPQ